MAFSKGLLAAAETALTTNSPRDRYAAIWSPIDDPGPLTSPPVA
jgi:hypothetical protein